MHCRMFCMHALGRVNVARLPTQPHIPEDTSSRTFLIYWFGFAPRYVLKRVRMARQNDWQRAATKQEIKLVSTCAPMSLAPYVGTSQGIRADQDGMVTQIYTYNQNRRAQLACNNALALLTITSRHGTKQRSSFI